MHIVSHKQKAMTRKELNQALKKYNATLEISNESMRYTLYEVIAPDGFQWFEGGSQILVYYRVVDSDFKDPMANVYADLIQRMEYGLEQYAEII